MLWCDQLLKKWESRERKKIREAEKEREREDERKEEEVRFFLETFTWGGVVDKTSS